VIFIGVKGGAKPISIRAFCFCVFTTTALLGCNIYELVVDVLASVQAKILTIFWI